MDQGAKKPSPKIFPVSNLSPNVEPFVPKYFQEFQPVESVYYPIELPPYHDMHASEVPPYTDPSCMMPFQMYPPQFQPYPPMYPGLSDEFQPPPHWNDYRPQKYQKTNSKKGANQQNFRKNENFKDSAPSWKPHPRHDKKYSENRPPENKESQYPISKKFSNPPLETKKNNAKFSFTHEPQRKEISGSNKHSNKNKPLAVEKSTSSACDKKPLPPLKTEDPLYSKACDKSKLCKTKKYKKNLPPVESLVTSTLEKKQETAQSTIKPMSYVEALQFKLGEMGFAETKVVSKLEVKKPVSPEEEYPELSGSHNKSKVKSSQKSKAIVETKLQQSKGLLPVAKVKSSESKTSSVGKKAEKTKSNHSKTLELDFSQLLKLVKPKMPQKKKREPRCIAIKSGLNKGPHNMLDSTAPLIKRGKEREKPRAKKHSSIKKIIMIEKERKRKLRESSQNAQNLNVSEEDEKLMEATSEPMPENNLQEEPLSALVENVQNLPSLNVPMTNYQCAKLILHTRKYRDYCTHLISPELNNVVLEMLTVLMRFQERMFLKDPIKAKSRRRVICGLREITKHVKLHKLKAIIIAPDVERIDVEGGLMDSLKRIQNLAQEQNVKTVYALQRSTLGRSCLKKVPASCVGIFNYDGADLFFKNMVKIMTQKTWEYERTIAHLEEHITEEIRETLTRKEDTPRYFQWLSNLRISLTTKIRSIVEEELAKEYCDSDSD